MLGAFLVACVIETALVTLQAWRGVPSHFDFATPFDTAVSMTLAAGGAVIVVVGLVCAAAAFLGASALATSMALAVRAGLVVLLVALATGAVMIARGVVEARTGQAQLAYDTAGSLKPLHAVAMHAVLVLPALAWLLAHTSWPEERRLRLVRVAVAADAVLTVWSASRRSRASRPSPRRSRSASSRRRRWSCWRRRGSWRSARR